MLQKAGFAIVIGSVLLITGCSSKTSTASNTPRAAATAAKTSASPKSPSAPPSPSAAAETIPDSYDASRNPAADVKAALKKAAADHKEVLIDFGANWCPDCRNLDKLFHSKSTMPLVQRDYHVVAVDVGEFNLNLVFTQKYVNLSTSGIPALAVLAPDGKVRVTTNDGSFENARTMDSAQVNAFLTRWASGRS